MDRRPTLSRRLLWIGANLAIYCASVTYLWSGGSPIDAPGTYAASHGAHIVGEPQMIMALVLAAILLFLNGCWYLWRAAATVRRAAPPNER